MNLKIYKDKFKGNYINILLMAAIFLWPLCNSFKGIDLADTGYHIFNYANLFDNPDKVSFSTYLSSLIGWLWLKIFGFLGAWGLNFLEIIIEMITVFLIYRMLKNYLGKTVSLLGAFFSILISNTYFNIVNYHQLTMFFYVMIIYFLFYGLKDHSIKKIFISGLVYGFSIFVRLPNIVAVCIGLGGILYWYLISHEDYRFLIKSFLSFIFGAIVSVAMMILVLMLNGQLVNLYNSIFRLGGMAGSSGGYNLKTLVKTFVKDNIQAVNSGALFSIWTCIVIFIYNAYIDRQQKIKQKVFSAILLIFAIIAAGCGLYLAYKLNDKVYYIDPRIGLFAGVQYVAVFIFMLVKAKSPKDPEMSLAAFFGIVLMALMPVGSNVGIKHSILGMWINLPIVVYVLNWLIREGCLKLEFTINTVNYKYYIGNKAIKVVLSIMSLVFTVLILNFSYKINNYDDYNRSNLKYTINSEKLKFLTTTERESAAVNGVLEALEPYKKDNTLMIFGNAVLFYYMTEMNPYLDKPWASIDSYTDEDFVRDLKNKPLVDSKLPVVLKSKTNNYDGFKAEEYQRLLDVMKKVDHGEKGASLYQFLTEHNYNKIYENDYYIIYAVH